MKLRIALAALLAGLLVSVCSADDRTDRKKPSTSFGHFSGQPKVTLVDPPPNMRLDKPFFYVDPKGKKWNAPAGYVANGASIPRSFWTVIGGPLSGPYRNASIVHDVACDEKKEPAADVHRMFYYACRCGGVGKPKARLMYWAVYYFGPSWKPVRESRVVEEIVDGAKVSREIVVEMWVHSVPEPPSEVLVKKAESYFKHNDPSLDEIESGKLKPLIEAIKLKPSP